MGLSKKIFITSHRFETSVAVLEDNMLVEMFVERDTSKGKVGNIYKGRVGKVLPGIQSAFVDVDLDRDTFLHVSDVVGDPKTYPQYLIPDDRRYKSQKHRDDSPIQSAVRSGQEMLVQVVKEAVGTKGARVTMQVALPGRYFVYMPGTGLTGISKRIPEYRERQRLRRIVNKNKLATDGFITRTASEGAEEDLLIQDMENLIATWESVKRRAKRSHAPSLIHTDVPMVIKILRDTLSHDVEIIVVDDDSTFEMVKTYLDQSGGDFVGELIHYQERTPLFIAENIEEEIQTAIQSKIWLSSGGHIVVNQTEALVSIDVNTGRFTGSKNLEDTVLKLNLEAVREVVRQIRLRDLGGIVVIDFIDMENEKNRRRVLQAFREELRRDRSQSKILQISDFGLIEMTRKRSRTNLQRMLCQTCPYCDGSGKVKNEPTVALEIRRRVLKLSHQLRGNRLLIRCHPDVIDSLKAYDGLLPDLENTVQKYIDLQAEPTYHHEEFDVLDGDVVLGSDFGKRKEGRK